MKNKAYLPLLAMVILGVGLSHFGLKSDENGTLLLVDNRPVDVKGELSNYWTSLTRDCSRIRTLTSDEDMNQQTKKLIQSYSPPNSSSVKLFTVIASEEWILAEAEFTDLLPAVALIRIDTEQNLKLNAYSMHVIPNAVWSGYTKPWKAAPYIRQYISSQAREAPAAMTNCFDPQSHSFNE